jgi:hypothetical protein
MTLSLTNREYIDEKEAITSNLQSIERVCIPMG